jgi:hypothetical protein
MEYAKALGGRLRLTIDSADLSFEVGLEGVEERELDPRRSYRVIWQDAETRSLVHVGWLERTRHEFEFSYTDEARRNERFAPFPAFPKLDDVYRSSELFPFFAVRLISTADPNYAAVLEAIGLNDREATPAELLALAPDSQHDTIQVVPEPTEEPDGTLQRTFLVSGVRYAEADSQAAASILASLRPGAHLELAQETTNEFNSRAIQLLAEGTPVGWLPNYLLDEVHGYFETGRTVAVIVERANGPEAPPHVRLQCRLIVSSR